MKQNAKINLTLNVLGKNGTKHTIDSVMASINLYDSVTIFLRNDLNINVMFNSTTCNIKDIDNVNNTAFRMAELMQNKYKLPGVDIYVNKNIPVASGLGGSSADAIAVARCLDKIFKLRLENEEYNELFNIIGSDLLAMSTLGYKRVTGFGENIEIIDSCLPLNLLLIMKNGVNTSLCYQKFDEICNYKALSSNDLIIVALYEEDLDKVCSLVSNALYFSACKIDTSLNSAIIDLKQNNAKAAFMSGSGGTCVGIFETIEEAEQCKNVLCDTYPFCIVAKTIFKNKSNIIMKI